MGEPEVMGLVGLPYQQIVENLDEIVWLSDAATGRVLYLTPNFERFWGLPRELIYADRSAALEKIHPDDRERIRHGVADDQAAGRYNTEYRLLGPDGALRWVHSRAMPVHDDSGAPSRIVGVIRDITDRKRAELALVDSQERLGLFVRHVPASLAMFDRELRYLVVSERWAQTNGMASGELMGRRHYDVFPGTPAHVKALHERALRGESYRCEEERFVRPDGTEYWLRWEVHPWRHEGSAEVAGIIVFTEDISERKRSQALMLEIAHGVSAETGAGFFQALVDNLSRHTGAEWVTVGELVGDGRQLRDIAKRTKGLPVSRLQFDIAGRPCEAVLQRRDLCIWTDGVAESFPADSELRLHGMRAFAGVPLFGEGGVPIGVVSILAQQPMADVQRVEAVLQIFAARAQAELVRVRREREILELNASLEQRIRQRTALLEAANRDLEAFSYSVSHDLRAPLRAIDGYLAIAAEDGPLSDLQRLSFEKVQRNVKRMNELITELMGLAQVDRQAMLCIPLDLADLARSVVGILRERDPLRSVEVRIEPAPAQADPQALRIVLENLIGNAWKFTSKTARAGIRFGTEAGEDGQIVYVLEDNGAGFDPVRASRLFQPFQRLHSMKEFEGTGIGLATVERIIRRHGGRIWADAKPGEGATFRFTLGKPD